MKSRILILVLSVVSLTTQLMPQESGLVPLFRLYNDERGDNFTTTDTRWQAVRVDDVIGTPPYRYHGIEGRIFSRAQPGTVPLMLWYSARRGDNLTTADPAWRSTPQEPSYALAERGIEGYVFAPDAPQPAGTIPLFSVWSPSREDNFLTTDRYWQGTRFAERVGDPSLDYVFVRTEGYIYPAGGTVGGGVLTVPRVSVPVRVDGYFDFSTEYLGATALPLTPAPDATTNTSVLFVHDNVNLYLAFETPGFEINPGRAAPTISLFFRRAAGGAGFHASVRMDTGQLETHQLYAEGVVPIMAPGPGPTGLEAKLGLFGGEFVHRSAEVRIPLNALPPGVIQFAAVVHYNGAGSISPVAADLQRSATWVGLTMGSDATQIQQSTISGKLFLRRTDAPLPDREVVVSAGEGFRVSARTDRSGSFSVPISVPLGRPVSVLPDIARANWACVEAGGVGPGLVAETTYPGAIFPPAAETGAQYQMLRLRVAADGPPEIHASEPTAATDQFSYRSDPTAVGDDLPTFVRIRGKNFSRCFRPLLVPTWCRERPVLQECRNLVRPLEIISVAEDGTSMLVKVPGRTVVDSQERSYSWALLPQGFSGQQNTQSGLWVDPADSGHTAVFGYPSAVPFFHSGTFRFANNLNGGPSLPEYLSVFQFNAYSCQGIRTSESTCVGMRHWDPFYIAYYAIYSGLMALSAGKGECTGFSATCLLMARGSVPVNRYDPGVLAAFAYPAPVPVRWSPDGVELAWNPAQPASLFAEFRRNQGVIQSAEYISQFVHQQSRADLRGTLNGDPVEVLERLRPTLGAGFRSRHVISMFEGSITNWWAHSVVPLEIRDIAGSEISKIVVYDPNSPYPASGAAYGERVIEVDRRRNTYKFDDHRGNQIIAVPIELWERGRHAPGVDEITMVIAALGAAAVREAIVPVPMASGRSDGTGQGLYVLPGVQASNAMALRGRGTPYLFHSAAGGVAAQYRTRNAPNGELDQITLSRAENKLSGIAVRPASAREVEALTMVVQKTQDDVAAFSFSGMRLPALAAVAFKADPSGRSIQFMNDSSAPVQYSLSVMAVDGAAEIHSQRRFPAMSIPSGATQTFRLAQWPTNERILVETDLNRDGRPESSTSESGLACGIRLNASPVYVDQCEVGYRTPTPGNTGPIVIPPGRIPSDRVGPNR